MTSRSDLVPQPEGGGGALEARQRPSDGAQPIRLRFIWGMVRRNAWIILGTVAVCLATAIYLTRGMVPQYSAAVSVRIDARPSDLPALDVLRSTSGNEVNTEMGMLRSRTLAAAVADSLGLQLRVLEPPNVLRSDVFVQTRIDTTGGAVLPSGRFELTPVANTRMQLRAEGAASNLATLKPGDHVRLGSLWFQLAPGAYSLGPLSFEIKSLDAAVDQLLSGLKVTRPNREANLVEVRYEDTDKGLARDVPNLLAALFINERRVDRQSATRSTAEFLNQQIVKLSAQLRVAEDSLQRFREGAQIVSLPTEASSGVNHAADLEAQRNALDAERSALARLLDDASRAARSRGESELSPYQSFLGFPSFLRNQAVGTLLSSLKAADDKRAEMLTRRQPQDPEVLQLDSRVKELEGQLQSVAQTYLAGLTNQVSAMDATLRESRHELARIPAKEAQFARLERSVKGLEEIVLQLRSRLKETEVAEVANDETVRLIDVASAPRAPLQSRRPLILAFACCVGLALGMSIGLGREYLNTSVQTQMDVESATGIPIIGWIPHIQIQKTRRLAASTSNGHPEPQNGGGPAGPPTTLLSQRSRPTPTGVLMSRGSAPTPLSDAYEQVHTSMLFSRREGELHSIAFTSGLPGGGKTTNAANYAVTLAQGGRRIILVDADLRRGRLAKLFGASREPGLVDLLDGAVSLENSLRWVSVGGGKHMYLLPTGRLPTNPAQLLGSAAMRELLARLEAESDMVILDCPPLNIVADATVLGRQVDGVLLVVRLGTTPFDSLVHTAEQLQAASIPVLGTILNDIRFDRAVGYDDGFRWYEYAKSHYARAEPE
jgi:capsular exopolysaccharide synthesis family protein